MVQQATAEQFEAVMERPKSGELSQQRCGGLYGTKLRTQRTDNGSTGHGCRSR